MLDYLIKTEIAGIEIRLVYSQAPNAYYVIYGLEKKKYNHISHAKNEYDTCIKHALECALGDLKQ